jgi:hypothetical protein
MLGHRRDRGQVSAWRGSPIAWQELGLPMPARRGVVQRNGAIDGS